MVVCLIIRHILIKLVEEIPGANRICAGVVFVHKEGIHDSVAKNK